MGQLAQITGGFRADRYTLQPHSTTAEGARSMTCHLAPNGVGNKDFAKIIEQVKAAELVQVNQWPGITDDDGPPFNFGHAVPTRRPRERISLAAPADEHPKSGGSPLEQPHRELKTNPARQARRSH